MQQNDNKQDNEHDEKQRGASDHARHGGAGGGGNDAGTPADDHRQDEVSITVNNASYGIHRGRRTVEAIKRVAGVPLADELARVSPSDPPALEPLADDGSVTLKGGEAFISYPRQSGSAREVPPPRAAGGEGAR